MRQAIARFIDDPISPSSAPITGLPPSVATPASLGPASSPTTARLTPGANKATYFIQACCQSRTPLLYLNNTTGYMVGKAYEEAGMIKHGSKMIQAVTSRRCRRSPIAAFVRRRQLRHRWPVFTALLLLLAECQDRRDGRRAVARPWRSSRKARAAASRSRKRSWKR
jgi:hypothetical protein